MNGLQNFHFYDTHITTRVALCSTPQKTHARSLPLQVCPCSRIRDPVTSERDEYASMLHSGLGIVRILGVRSLPHLAERRLLELTST